MKRFLSLILIVALLLSIMPTGVFSVTASAKTTDFYTITYHLDGGTNAIKNPDVYTTQDTITLMPATKVGYDFAGWYLDSAKKEPISEISKCTGDLELYAKYTPQKYEATFNFQGGTTSDRITITLNDTLGTTKQYVVESGGEFNPYQTWKLPKRDGYVFAGWEYNGNLVKNTITTNNEIELKAIWKTANYSYCQMILGIDRSSISNSGTYFNGELGDYDSSATNTSSGYLRSTYYVYVSGEYKNVTYSGYSFDRQYKSGSKLCYSYGGFIISDITQGVILVDAGSQPDYNASSSYNNRQDYINVSLGVEPGTLLRITVFGYTNDPNYAGYYGAIWNTPVGCVSLRVGDLRDSINVAYSGQRLISQEYDAAIRLPTLSRDGYEFVGWYDENEIRITDNWEYLEDKVFNAKWHYSTCNGQHIYTSDCDNSCNTCQWIRETSVSHKYSTTCDTICDLCDWTRIAETAHTYSNACDTECNSCKQIRTTTHTYDNDCDTLCNECGDERTVPDHIYDNACDTLCNVCGCIRTVPAHVYNNDCDDTCNICGTTRVIYHLYDMECDVTCNKCGTTRVVPHFYDDESDSFCNLCGHNRAKASGKTGDCDWYVIDTTLYITGNGAMVDYNTYSTLPWGKTITEVVIKDGVTKIGSYAFSGCSKLRTITIPGSVVAVGEYAFSNCTSLADVTIEDGVATIGNYAFNYCYALNSINVPGSVTSIGDYAFRSCSSLTSIVMNPGTTQIGKYAFYSCSKLSSITIPNSITTIGADAFYSCSALSSVYITDLKAWCEIDFADYDDNPLYRADNLYLNGEKVTELNIPSGTTTIKKYAFAYFDGFSSVTIPSSVTSIGNYAFYKCTNLTAVTMETDIETIGSYAFAGCSSLASVIIPNSITTIGDHAFYECTGLSSLTIQNGVKTIGTYAFSYCKALTFVAIPDSVTSVGNYAFYCCSGLTLVMVGDGITQITERSFYACSNLTDVALGKSVRQIDSYAFYSCSNLKEVWYKGTSQSDISISSGNTPLTNANWHCNVDVVEEHIYDSVCDVFCNICDNVRTVLHVYDNACDTSCNVCGKTRQVPDHIYSGICDADCNECGLNRTVPDHVYENACDTDCNECGHVRTVSGHMYDNVCDTTCNECGYIRQVSPHFVVETVEEHVLTNSTTYPFTFSDGWYSSTNKSDYTSSTFTLTAKHDCELTVFYKISSEQNYDKLIIKQNSATLVTASGTVSETSLTVALAAGDVVTFTYSKDGSRSSGSDVAQFKLVTCDCDTYVEAESVAPSCVHSIVCSGCGLEIKPISTVHTYDNVCDTTCNECGFVRTAPHEYDHACDTTCNECGYVRTVPDHVYDDGNDRECNECGFVAYISGDVTGDDKINSLDGLLLMRYLNGWNVYIASPEAMDVNGDGKVNSLDGLILMRYLNGWNVTLG